MSAEIQIFRDPERTLSVDVITLSEATINGSVGTGEEHIIYGKNSGDTAIRGISVGLSGEGAHNVQLATMSGVWASAGQEIMVVSDTLMPNDTFEFRARAVYTFEDHEGQFPFSFVVKGTSTGE